MAAHLPATAQALSFDQVATRVIKTSAASKSATRTVRYEEGLAGALALARNPYGDPHLSATGGRPGVVGGLGQHAPELPVNCWLAHLAVALAVLAHARFPIASVEAVDITELSVNPESW